MADGEILSTTNEQINDEDEEDTSKLLAEVSVKEARALFEHLTKLLFTKRKRWKSISGTFSVKKYDIFISKY